jgi:hypothetical protein
MDSPAGATDSEAISDDGDAGMTHFGSDQQGVENLDDLSNRSCPPCYLPQGRVCTNRLNPDTHHDFAGALGDALTTNNPNGRPEPEGVNAYTADDSGTLTVIVQPRDFRLPDVLRHIEAGKIVLVIPPHNGPDQPPS